MNEVTTTKLVAIMAVIFVTAALVTLPYQNQVANAAPAAKKYQVYVTLIGVPANAEDLIMNVTIIRLPFFVSVSETQIKTVSSPSEGETVKFVLTVPAGSNETNVFVCGTRVPSGINDCEVEPLPSKGGGPIRVDFTYPQGP
jgi:hypothetical protein